MALWKGSSMNATEYKSYHESYMANNYGTTASHVFSCISFTVQCAIYNAVKGRYPGPSNIAFEYISIVLPLTLAHTILANYIHMLNVLILFVCIYDLKLYYPRLSIKSIVSALKQKNEFRTKQIQSISCIRGLTYLITVYAILAVDFKAFRKDLRKTEQYGYSLMDTGVGLFTLMSGLVHKDLQNYSLKQIFKSNLKFFLVLFALGTARFWTVKALDYHEHVTEYGVHWNFFFTVAMCKLIATILLYISNRTFLFAIATLVTHEYLLANGLQRWVFSNAPRNDLLSANREGICSCLGYTALYLYGAHLKKILSEQRERYLVFMALVFESIILWSLAGIINVYRPISRTLANSGYCVYLSAILVVLLAILYFLEVTHQNKKGYFETPIIISAVNQNGLLYFLVANLITGAINLSIQTLFVPQLYAVLIMNVYMIVTLALMVYLRDKGIKV